MYRPRAQSPTPVRLVSRGFVLFLMVLGPAAMAAGLLDPPSTLYGPNGALGIWIPITVIGVSTVAVGAQTLGNPIYLSSLRSLALYVAALLYGALSPLWSPNPLESARLSLQLAVLIPVFMAAWQMRLDATGRDWVRRTAAVVIAVLWVMFLAAWATGFVGRGDLARLMGIVTLGLPPLFVLSTFARYSTWRTVVCGVAAIALALASDARMVALVLAILILTSPALDVRAWIRAGIAIGCGLLIAALVVFDGAPGQVFFFDEGGSVSRPGGGDTGLLGGRAAVWDDLWDQCEDGVLAGNGLGASNVWGQEIDSTFPEPHNEYLRTVCDLGVPGAALFWSFFLLVGVHAVSRLTGRMQRSASAIAALQLLTALFLLAATDIPLTATAQFYAPLALVLGWSERAHQDQLV
jgi:hypothetical protein